MGNYNSKILYNRKASAEGLIYNSGALVVFVSFAEVIKTIDADPTVFVKALIKEQVNIEDFASVLGLITVTDFVGEDDSLDIGVKAIINVFDNLNLQDELINALCKAHVIDNSLNILDEFSALTKILIEDNLNVQDNFDLKAIIEIADSANLNDIASLLAKVAGHDNIYVEDKEPKTSVSDFYINDNLDGVDNGFRWLTPFDLMINEAETSIQVMPQTESTYTSLPKVNGELISDTLYKNRFFTVVGYSLQGMTDEQKHDLQQTIAELLDSTKEDFKKMTIGETGTVFDVKYSGQAVITEAPSWVKASLPFEVKPYGRKNFAEEFEGNGLIYNTGDKETGPIVTISAGCVNPSFSIGELVYNWEGTVPENRTLVIDFEDTTCYLVDNFGVKYQALHQLTKTEWAVIQKKQPVEFLCLNDSTKEHVKVTYNIYILWKG